MHACNAMQCSTAQHDEQNYLTNPHQKTRRRVRRTIRYIINDLTKKYHRSINLHQNWKCPCIPTCYVVITGHVHTGKRASIYLATLALSLKYQIAPTEQTKQSIPLLENCAELYTNIRALSLVSFLTLFRCLLRRCARYQHQQPCHIDIGLDT